MTFKKFVLAGVALASTVALAACSGGKSESSSDVTELTIGVMTRNDSDVERWEAIEEGLKDKKVTLKYVEFTDYSQPNKALANGEVDINAFQHYNFLNNWNEENGEELVTIAETYISPIHLFSGTDASGKVKYKSVKDIPDGAQIAVPNDATNESRALYVLQTAGLIKLDVSGDTLATIANITENPKNLDIKELDASQTARSLVSADAAIVNNNYAVAADLDYATSIFKEESNADSKQWINVIAGQPNWEKSEKAAAIKALVEAYHTDHVKKVIDKATNGIDVPVW